MSHFFICRQGTLSSANGKEIKVYFRVCFFYSSSFLVFHLKKFSGIGAEENIIFQRHLSLLTLFDGEDCLFFFLIERQTKQFQSPPPHPPKPNWFCLLLLQKPIYFSICNGQLKCNGGKKEKIPYKRGKKNKCVSGSVYTQRWVSFIFVARDVFRVRMYCLPAKALSGLLLWTSHSQTNGTDLIVNTIQTFDHSQEMGPSNGIRLFAAGIRTSPPPPKKKLLL